MHVQIEPADKFGPLMELQGLKYVIIIRENRQVWPFNGAAWTEVCDYYLFGRIDMVGPLMELHGLRYVIIIRENRHGWPFNGAAWTKACDYY